MSADNIFIQESCDSLGVSFFKGVGFWPFHEVVNGDNNVVKSSEGPGEGSDDIYSHLMEGDRVLWDGVERGFSSSAASFLAGFAGVDVFSYIPLDSWPVVLFGDFLVGVFFRLMSGEVMVVVVFEDHR